MQALGIFASFVEAVGLMALLAMTFGTLERSALPRTARSLLSGLGFGLAGVVAMLSPAVVEPGLIMDGRAIIVGLGAAFCGPLAGLVGALIAGAFRAFAIGGPGAVPGTFGIFLAAALGLAWMHVFVPDRRPNFRQLLLGGVVISLHFGLILLLPREIATGMLTTIYPILLVMSVAATLMLGMLMARERRLIDIERELERAALFDPLTSLPNRRHFEETFPRGRQGDERRRSTLLVLDIDRFKTINDSHGHAAGDAALRSFAAVLRSSLRTNEVAARMGGEEFAILLAGLDTFDALHRLETLLAEIRRTPIRYGSAVFHLTASAGVAEFDPGAEEADEVLKRADEALYEAKRAGRDRYVVADFAEAA